MRRLLSIATLALAGCATVPPAPVTVDWDLRQQELLALDHWRMTGRVAVTVNGDGASASIDWRQSGETADLAVSGPLGVGALRAILDGSGLRLEDGSGARVEGADAERLLAERLGAEMPVRSLRYWMLGIPAPGEPYEQTRSADGRPELLRQSGWQVEFSRFGAAPGGELPVRLTIARDGARVKLAVTRWDLGP
ncbi:MAG: outer rane lipoprotein LolB [Proteobacteria bacterium]|nr:outer rane lipoprotein LolB [Pseudomonadota bacterium]